MYTVSARAQSKLIVEKLSQNAASNIRVFRQIKFHIA